MTLLGPGQGQISSPVCVWVGEADGLSLLGTACYRFITESRALSLKKGKVG